MPDSSQRPLMNCVLGAATRFPICAFLAFVIACFSPASACAQVQWVEVKSPHFSVLTDGGEKRGREVSLQFEQMRSVLAQLFLQDKISASAALRVIAMQSEKQGSQFAPMYQGKPVKIVGFYLHSTDEDFILVDLGAPNRWETVFHEYA